METTTIVIIAVVLLLLLCCCSLLSVGIATGVIYSMGDSPEEETTSTIPPPLVGVVGRYVKLTRPTIGYMLFTEIVIKSSADGPNIAKNATITQSSTFDTDGKQYPSSNFVDDDQNTWMHTSGKDAPWVLLDLGIDVPIYSIVVSNRIPQGSRAQGTVVTIENASKNVIYTSKPFVGKTDSITPSEESNGHKTYTMFPPNIDVTATT
jgi:hypothetical protein